MKVRIYKTVILPVVLYGCETWTLTLREEQRLRVFENKVVRKIFGAKRDEVTGVWRKLHNAELHALYTSPDIIKNIKSRCLRWAGHVVCMGESRNAYRVLVGRPEGKRPLGRPRRRCEDIKMDLREVGYDGRDWINLAQDRDQWRAYVRAAMNLRKTASLSLRHVLDGRAYVILCCSVVFRTVPYNVVNTLPNAKQYRICRLLTEGFDCVIVPHCSYVTKYLNCLPQSSVELRTRNSTLYIRRTIGERYLEKNKEVCIVFVDLEKAFDIVDWNKLMDILKKISVYWKDRRLFSNLYMKRVRVSIGEEIPEETKTVYLEDLVKNCFQNKGGVKVGGRRIKSIRFVDDMALLAEEETILRDMLLELNDSYILRHHMMKGEWNGEKLSPAALGEDSIRHRDGNPVWLSG
ncbi:hypothetical protein ANN_23131 [Periplaneta americana]|uniref:Reverse transcriptase domain-containing protein n=1 Tax=Periplaneta americana TaxID=6978 RepID=A0ABQ8SL42_PERAM|nr:hypothetical protein ANN_23131 [Periplaneta americana]